MGCSTVGILTSISGDGKAEDLGNVAEAQAEEEILPASAELNGPMVMGSQ